MVEAVTQLALHRVKAGQDDHTQDVEQGLLRQGFSVEGACQQVRSQVSACVARISTAIIKQLREVLTDFPGGSRLSAVIVRV